MSDHPNRGIAMVLTAYFLFSCLDTSAKWLAMTAALPALQLAFFRYFGHFVVTLLQAAGSGGLDSFRMDRQAAPMLLARSCLLTVCTASNFVAIGYLPLTTIATINFSAPLLVCALSGPILGERVGPWRWGAILVGFIGVLVAMRPDSGFHWSMLFSIAAALSFALYSVLSRRLVGRVSVASMQMYTGLIGAVLLGPLAWLNWQTPTTGVQWGLLLGIGLIAWLGHEIFTRAHAFAPASVLIPFSYSLFLYMCLWGWLIFSQLPDFTTLIAVTLVVGAGVTIWYRETRVRRERE